LTFKPVKFLTREQWEIAREKGDSPAAKAAITQTPASMDGVKKKASIPKAAAVVEVEEEIVEPTKRVSKKNAEPAAKKDFADVINSWSTDD
jgi:hypothetical protein